MPLVNERFNKVPLKYLWAATRKYAAFVFAIATTIVTFIPVDELLDKLNRNKLEIKIAFLLALCVISFAIAWIVGKTRNKVTIFSREAAGIEVIYGDLKDYIADNPTDRPPYTVVIPINTRADTIGDIDVIRKHAKSSMHLFWLEQMEKCGYNKADIEKLIRDSAGMKINAKNLCQLGNYCYIRNIQNVNYFLLVSSEIKSINGIVSPTCTEEQYFGVLQSMIATMEKICPNDEKIYIPVIGGGYARKNHSNGEQLRIMAEIMLYNKASLNNKLIIVAYQKYRQDISILSLRAQD